MLRRSARLLLLASCVGLMVTGCSRAHKDAVSLINQGVEAMRRGDASTAEAHFAHAATLDPEYAVAHYQLGLVHYYKLDEPDQALKDFETAHRLNPKDIDVLFQLGRYHTTEGDAARGLLLLEQALKLDWNHAACWYYKGQAFRKMDRTKDADKAWRESIALDPGQMRPYRAMGELYESVGASREARAVYEAGLQHTGRHADLLNAIGVMTVRLGDAPDAVPFFEEAIERDSGRMDSVYNLAFAYAEAGEAAKAIAQLHSYMSYADPMKDRENLSIAVALRDALRVEAKP
ncbi:MAG: tetratricopeptide repeat protein [Myxococcota bacterium]|nr:tetratricopeptide repeat protein [Myxococcota bacterium]